MSASAGRVLILPKGDYDNTVEYKMLDMVTYQNGSYLCKQTTTGNLPTDTTYWQEMVSVDDMTGASAGAAGVHGLVPAPSAGSQAKFLRGDATWAEVDLSSKADQSIIGGSYNAATAYEPGDRFSYNGVRYKVIIESGTVSGQTPPNATYYEVCSVDDDICQLNNSLMVKNINITSANVSISYSNGLPKAITMYSCAIYNSEDVHIINGIITTDGTALITNNIGYFSRTYNGTVFNINKVTATLTGTTLSLTMPSGAFHLSNATLTLLEKY